MVELGDERADADACDGHHDEHQREPQVVEVVDVDPRRDAERSHAAEGDAKEPTEDGRDAPHTERPTGYHQAQVPGHRRRGALAAHEPSDQATHHHLDDGGPGPRALQIGLVAVRARILGPVRWVRHCHPTVGMSVQVGAGPIRKSSARSETPPIVMGRFSPAPGSWFG